MKIEVAVLGSLLAIVHTVSMDVNNIELNFNILSSEFKSCVKVDVDVLGSLPLTVHTVSMDVK